MTGEHQIVAGFMPLLDSAILVAAREKGFAAAEAIDLVLARETSWANIRDRMAVGHFQVAHVLAPMPIASNLGLTPLAVPVVAPMALGLGGNAVTVSTALWAHMVDQGATPDFDPVATGKHRPRDETRFIEGLAGERAKARRTCERLCLGHVRRRSARRAEAASIRHVGATHAARHERPIVGRIRLGLANPMARVTAFPLRRGGFHLSVGSRETKVRLKPDTTETSWPVFTDQRHLFPQCRES